MGNNMRFEMLLRKLFGNVDRYGDPAGLATTDIYSNANLPQAKAALAYAVEVIRSKLTNPEVYETQLDTILNSILASMNTSDLDPSLNSLEEIAVHCNME